MIKQLKFVFAAGVAAGLFGAGGVANAATCSSIITNFNLCSGSASCEAVYLSNHPECFGSNRNTAAGAKTIQGTSLGQVLAISSSVGSRSSASAPPGRVADSGARNGLAAGNPSGKWNVWANVSQSDIEYDRGTYFLNNANRTIKFDSRIDNVVLGGDYQYAPNIAVGLSAAFDRGGSSVISYNVDTATAAQRAAISYTSTNGYSFAPYLGWQINKDWALDATVGWGDGKSTVDGQVKTDSKRFFSGANLGFTSWRGNWQLTGKGGYLFGQEKSDDSKSNGATLANTKITNEVGQFRLAGQAAYWMNGVMPYFGVAYSSDSLSGTATADQRFATEMGKDAWVWSLGVNFISIKNAMTGGIGYEQETGRDRSKNSKLMANINVRF